MPVKVKTITWAELNRRLKDCTMHEAESLLERVKSEGKSAQFVLRVTNRLNRLRGQKAIKENLSGKR